MKEVVKSIANWFAQAVPEPTDRNRMVQLGVCLEEVSEVLAACGLGVGSRTVEHLANGLKAGLMEIKEVDRIALLDGLCDVVVTAIGVAHMYGFDFVGALAEVDRANWSKFVDGKPLFTSQGKIAKSVHYTPPALDDFV